MTFDAAKFAGKTAEEIVAMLKAESESKTAKEAFVEKYSKHGISLSTTGKIMLKVRDKGWPATFEMSEWLFIVKMAPVILDAVKDYATLLEVELAKEAKLEA